MGVVGAVGATPDLVLQTNSTERIRILSGGNVGIGTTSPEAKLDVSGTIAGINLYGQIGHSTGGKVRFWADTAGQNFISNYWVTYNNTNTRWEWNATTSVGGVKLDFPNSGVFAVNVKSSAAVIAGNPVNFVTGLSVSDTTTTVGGNLVVSGSGASTFSGILNVTAASLGTFASTTANSTSGEQVFTIKGSNNNTDGSYAGVRAPGLAIWNNNGTANTYGGLWFQDGGGNAVAGIHGVFINDANNEGKLEFWTRPSAGNYTLGMTLSSAGNLGVGIAAPLSKLHIVGNGIIAQPASYGSGYVAGLKFRNEGYAHFTVGGKGSTFVISDTGADGTAVWNTTPIDLITVNASSGNTSILGSLTASGTGTSSFAGPLTISLAQNADTVLRVTNSDSQASARAAFLMTGQGNTWGTYVNNTYIRNYTASAADIEWWTSGIKRVTLGADGNFTVIGGIITSGGSSGQTLALQGNGAASFRVDLFSGAANLSTNTTYYNTTAALAGNASYGRIGLLAGSNSRDFVIDTGSNGTGVAGNIAINPGGGSLTVGGTISATGNIISSTSTNATQTVQVTNSNAANSALSRLVVSNGTYEGSITVYGTGFTDNNAAKANRMTIAAPFILHSVSGQHSWWLGTTGAGNDPTNGNQVMLLSVGGQFNIAPPFIKESILRKAVRKIVLQELKRSRTK